MKFTHKEQTIVFLVLWVVQATMHCLRSPLSVIKNSLETNLQLSKTDLKSMDMAMLLPYAATQLIAGRLVDRCGPTKTICFSLFCSSLAMVTFGVWNKAWQLSFLLVLQGAAQAPSLLGSSQLLTLWFANESLNSVFGFMMTSQSTGALLGTAWATWLMKVYGWRIVFLPLAIGSMCIALMVYILLKTIAADLTHLPTRDTSGKVAARPTSHEQSWCSLWNIPFVAEVAGSVFALSLVRYIVYFWIPMYLLEELNYSESQAGLVSTMFDIGGVIGPPLVGFILDTFLQTKTVLGIFVAMLAGTVCLVSFSITARWGFFCNSVFLMVAGSCNQAAGSLLAGPVSMNIGERDNRHVGVQVMGLTNGLGTVGGILEGPVMEVVSVYWSWTGMFVLLTGVSSAGTIALFSAAYRERWKIV